MKESTTPDGRTCVQHLHQPCISLQCQVVYCLHLGDTWVQLIFSQHHNHELHHEDDDQLFDFIHYICWLTKRTGNYNHALQIIKWKFNLSTPLTIHVCHTLWSEVLLAAFLLSLAFSHPTVLKVLPGRDLLCFLQGQDPRTTSCWTMSNVPSVSHFCPHPYPIFSSRNYFWCPDYRLGNELYC